MANELVPEGHESRKRRTANVEELARINRHADSLNTEASDVLEYQRAAHVWRRVLSVTHWEEK